MKSQSGMMGNPVNLQSKILSSVTLDTVEAWGKKLSLFKKNVIACVEE